MHAYLFGHKQGSIRLVLERNADQMSSSAQCTLFTGTCAFTPAPICITFFMGLIENLLDLVECGGAASITTNATL